MSSLFSLATFDVVCPFDPAIDGDASNLDKYFIERDMKHLVFKAGELPQVYTTRRLTRSQRSAIRERAKGDTVFEFAFALGVVSVTNCRMPDGSMQPIWKPSWARTATPGDAKMEALTELEMEIFPDDEAWDIGRVILERSGLRNGRPVYFGVQQSSVEGLAKIRHLSHLAALSTLPLEKPEEHKLAPAMDSNGVGELPTDAIAMESGPSPASPTDSLQVLGA